MSGGEVKMIQALDFLKTSIQRSSVTDVFRRWAVEAPDIIFRRTKAPFRRLSVVCSP